MTEIPNHHSAKDISIGLLESNWALIQKAGPQIADEVDVKSDGLSGNFLKQAQSISDFFRGDASYERALCKTCVLAVANPLARLAKDAEISQSHIAMATHTGFCTLSRHGSNHRSLVRVFIYPIMLALFAIFGSVFFSFFIMPTFEKMYAEFGIALPWMTRAFFYLGYLIRMYVVTILMVVFGTPPLLWLINWFGQEKREPGMSFLDLMLARKRPTVARWLLHSSLLIEAGVPNEEAIDRASLLSGKRWLKRLAAIRSHRIASDQPARDDRFFNRKNFHMADTAISTPHSPGQVTLLQQVATWYRDSSSSIIEWFVQLLTPLMLAFILFTIFFLLLSLFFPLMAIVSGLTGGGPGGFM